MYEEKVKFIYKYSYRFYVGGVYMSFEEGRVRKGIRKCVMYKTVMSRKLGKPVRRCAKYQPLR